MTCTAWGLGVNLVDPFYVEGLLIILGKHLTQKVSITEIVLGQ